ncbi:MAG: hypothetical protein ACRCTX_04120 [Afipia sp.]
MNYEAWRCTYQSSEQAARAAYEMVKKLSVQRDELLEAIEDAEVELGHFESVLHIKVKPLTLTNIQAIIANIRTRLQRGKSA